MEKIIQVPVPVPEANRVQLVQYVDSLIAVEEEPDIETLEGDQRPIDESIGTLPEPVTRGPLSVSSEPLKPLLLSDTKFERKSIVDFAHKYLEGNPRRIKRLLNTYRYVKILATRQGERTDTEEWQTQMVNWLGLTMRWPAYIEAIIEQGGVSSTISVDHLSEDQRPPAEVLDLLPDQSEIVRFARLAENFIVENPPRDKTRSPERKRAQQAEDTPEVQSTGKSDEPR